MNTKNYATELKAGIYFLLFCSILGASAGTWRINNSDASADFQSIQSAINDATLVNDGDTLFVEGSASGYNGFTCDRLLYIIGPGFRLAENPQTGANASYAVIVGAAAFEDGAQGSVFSGFAFSNSSSGYEVDIETDNITIMRCYLTRGLAITGTVNNPIIVQNYILDGISIGSSGWGFQGMIFNNNIVDGDINISSSITTPRTFASVNNNFFLEDVIVTTATFRNNIWDPIGVSASINVTSGVIENNLFFNSQLGTDNGNQGFSDNTNVFGDRSGRSFDQQWELADDSAFKNSGTDGTDPGPFGGSNPYILSGVPPLPIIYEINTAGFGNQETGLPVEIRVRSSN